MKLRFPCVSLLALASIAGACVRQTSSVPQPLGGGIPEADSVGSPPATVPAATATLEVLPSPEAERAAADALRAARELARSGNTVGAIGAIEQVGTAVPVLRGWTDVLAGMAAAEAGDTAQVRLRLEQSPDSLLVREWGWRVLLRALQRAGDPRRAAEAALTASRLAVSSPGRAAALGAAGDLLVRNGDSVQALDVYRRAIREAPTAAGALGAARALAGWRLDPHDQRLVGETLLQHGGVERAARLLEGYFLAGESAASDASLRLRLGEALMRARRYQDAERHLLLAAITLPQAEILAGRLRYREGRLKLAEQSFRSVAVRAGGSAEAAEALYLLGDIAHDRGGLDSARAFYHRSVATGAESEAALQSMLRLAAMAVAAGNASDAAREVSLYLERRNRPELRAPALYWAGRAAALGGDARAAQDAYRQAIELDPVSYYGVRALERLGRGLYDVPLASGPELDLRVADSVGIALFRARVLQSISLAEEARFELARLRAKLEPGSDALYLVAEEMQRNGQPVAAAILGREIARQRGAWDRRLLSIVYQFPYREAVAREARRNGLDPFLVAGLIRQESLFNPVAVSAAGAVGLMQVMPETGRSLARRVGIHRFTPAMLKEPDVNVRLGTLFLADQVRRYSNLAEVFAAYNAGPSRVATWKSSFPERSDEDAFVERIPFTETRDYVKRLRLNQHIYQLLYGAGAGTAARQLGSSAPLDLHDRPHRLDGLGAYSTWSPKWMLCRYPLPGPSGSVGLPIAFRRPWATSYERAGPGQRWEIRTPAARS